MIARIAFVVVLMFLGACVPQPVGPPHPGAPVVVLPPRLEVPRNRAALLFYRPAVFAGSANIYRIMVDGVVVADLRPGTRHAAFVRPGPVQVSAQAQVNFLNLGLAHAMMERPVLPLVAIARSTVYVRVTTGFAGGPLLQQVPEAVALRDLARLSGPPPRR